MTKIDDREIRLAELLALFTDKMKQNSKEGFVEEFLAAHPDYENDLRPILTTALTLKSSLVLPHLNQTTSEKLFARISAGLRKGKAVRPAIVLDRRPDFLILLLHFMKKIWNQDVWGRTKLVKLLFLLGKEAGCDQYTKDFYGHYAYSYGAFDKNVPKDAKILSRKRILKMSPTAKYESKTGLNTPAKKLVNAMYRLTPKGEKIASALIKSTLETNPSILNKIEKVIQEHGKKTTDELLSYTYKKYPETTIHSKVKDKYQ